MLSRLLTWDVERPEKSSHRPQSQTALGTLCRVKSQAPAGKPTQVTLDVM